jgi:hypothetical protein
VAEASERKAFLRDVHDEGSKPTTPSVNVKNSRMAAASLIVDG